MSTAASPRPPISPSRNSPHLNTSTPLVSRPSSSALASPAHNRARTPSSQAKPPTSLANVMSSPNYFGHQTTDLSFQDDDHSQRARQNWSPPSSAIRSVAAFSPAIVPVDQNPDFAAFRRVSEGSAKAFSLGTLHGNYKLEPPKSTKPQPSALPVYANFSGSHKPLSSSPTGLESRSMAPPARPATLTQESDPDTPNRSQKRHLSSDSSTSNSSPRKTGAVSDSTTSPGARPDRHVRTLSANFQSFSTLSMTKHRAETMPASSSQEESRLVTPQQIVNLLESAADDILVLDLRVSTHYAESRITGALNLCIPTTLLKRPSFNTQKLAETFKQGDQRSKFENWRSSRYIVVYDASASQLKDATVCLTTISKFESEGYQGTTYIVRGGFTNFAKRFPSYLDNGPEMAVSNDGSPKPSKNGTADLPPVIGGCPMPAAHTVANPFFSNIRQNMDLIGGVGQMPIKLPTPSGFRQDAIPAWLRSAADEQDRGARVADRFLQIEKREQKRMQEALSGNVSYGTPLNETVHNSVRIAGLEKGSKNRYNNIWPFEHTRVKLEGISRDGCDYFNANHISSPRSHKQYIATQGPIPATFNDFWNVVWQQDVRVIVMLTAEKEGGQIKAHNYWAEQRYGPFSVRHLSEHRASLEPAKIYRHRHHRPSIESTSSDPASFVRQDPGETASDDQPYVTVRRLTLSHEGRPFERLREVTQLQYSSWPDFGAPAHPTHLLGLVEQCDMIVRSKNGSKYGDAELVQSRPVLVHCSAGCGRTGTFCTVDSVLDMLRRQRNCAGYPKQPTPMEIEKPNTNSDSPFFTSSVVGISTPPTDKSGQQQQPRLDETWLHRDDIDLVTETVEDFRLQRLSMVQSLRQFVLCYETVLEWLALIDQQDVRATRSAT